MANALLSVSDKEGIVDFARGLVQRGWTVLSTGGTAKALREAGISVTEVSDYTGHPEIMDGRVKTLHPAVHAGLLGRRGNREDEERMVALGYQPIDLLAVNLYPFEQTIRRADVTDAEAIEQIDIGGPAMLRSAAKNHEAVWVVADPADYVRVLASIDAGTDDGPLRRSLAAKVFAHAARYDAAIAGYLQTDDTGPDSGDVPQHISLELDRLQTLRYGENPSQQAGFYRLAGESGGIPELHQLHGKELSYNNLLDVDGALLSIAAWTGESRSACAIIKHTTPCGLAIADSTEEAYRRALSTDPLSAFGSVVAFNGTVTLGAAELIRPNFVEAVVAPSFEPAALELLREKKNIRLLEGSASGAAGRLDYKGVRGGFLAQTRLGLPRPEDGWRIASEREPTPSEWEDLRFAWRAVAAVKSNAIVIARDGMTLGIGAGQMSRVDSSRIAVMKAHDNEFSLEGAVLASDAFFPFRDGVEAAAAAGVAAIIQPGGALRDEEVISAANEHGMAMVFTGERLFRH